MASGSKLFWAVISRECPVFLMIIIVPCTWLFCKKGRNGWGKLRERDREGNLIRLFWVGGLFSLAVRIGFWAFRLVTSSLGTRLW